MLATKPADVRMKQKEYFEQAYSGETVIVSRPQNHNVVIISEKRYNELLQAMRMQEYVSRLYGGRQTSFDDKKDPWDIFFGGIDMFTEDFMTDDAIPYTYEKREDL